MTTELAAVVLTRNEGNHIADCLGSLAWVDERVIFDSGSEDQTVQIALQSGAQVLHHAFENFCSQRNAALTAVEAKWIFFVDADERATPALAEEVRRVIRYDDARACAGWWVPRHNIMIGHRMRGGGWYPDPQLRLLRRGMARYDPRRPVHETVILDGPAGRLESFLIHYNYDSVAQFRRKMLGYTTLEAQILDQSGVRVRPWTYVTMPLKEFWRRFVTLDGYRDHLFGLLFCGLMGWYTLVSYSKLTELRARSRADR